ncbi:MAG: glycosyltransferase family 4 protein [Synechococcales bacterium]|nr:glycosyltransferase family 4 protein [Synechococcales bacterium]
MRILFLHPNFPAQFRHLALALAQNHKNQVVFGTTRRDGGTLPGVHKVNYQPAREAHATTHPYLRFSESAVLQGQAAYRMGQQLKDEGFTPDVIYGSSGWGATLFMKDIFPKARFHGYFEWFYHAYGSDVDFDPLQPPDADLNTSVRMKNLPILSDLWSCDQGLTPTHWQRSQFPQEFHSKLKVLHDGIDTRFFRPKPGAKLVLPSIGLDLSQAEEIVTYATRGMEPYRGFPQFMEAIALVQQRRPKCHVVIAGEDRVAYGQPHPDGKTYRQLMLEKLPLDRSRLHFTGSLPYPQYLQLLQASSVHIYLTYPFVLSWSMLEAMATGCLVIGSRTPPVQEVITDGKNGLLVDFFSPQEIADRVDEVLDRGDRLADLREKARESILRHYDLARLLPQQIRWLCRGTDKPGQVVPMRQSKAFRKI